MSSTPILRRQGSGDNTILRHKIHMYAYASVAFALFTMGCVFSGFAIFERQSQISRIWLAGPTTIAVALVLCGKVIIDRRPRVQRRVDNYDEDIFGIVQGDHIRWSQPCMKEIEANANDPAYMKIAHQTYGNDMVIENYYVDPPRLSKAICQQMPSDLESQIWNLRPDDDCLTNEKENREWIHLDYANLNGSVNTHQPPNEPCPDCAKKMCNDFPPHYVCLSNGDIPNSLLYQGEMFLLNDKQYLI